MLALHRLDRVVWMPVLLLARGPLRGLAFLQQGLFDDLI